MTNWLKRLFGGSGSSESEAPEPATAPPPPSTPSEPPPPAPASASEERPAADEPPARLALAPAEAQSQRFQRKKASMPTMVTAIRPRLAQNASHVSTPGKCTFIPKKPVRSVSGSSTTLKIVST